MRDFLISLPWVWQMGFVFLVVLAALLLAVWLNDRFTTPRPARQRVPVERRQS